MSRRTTPTAAELRERVDELEDADAIGATAPTLADALRSVLDLVAHAEAGGGR